MAEPTEANTNDQLDDQRCRAPAAMKTTPAILPSFGLACCAAGVLRGCAALCRPRLATRGQRTHDFTAVPADISAARSQACKGLWTMLDPPRAHETTTRWNLLATGFVLFLLNTFCFEPTSRSQGRPRRCGGVDQSDPDHVSRSNIAPTRRQHPTGCGGLTRCL